jgi:hypothetical protein
MKVDANTKPPVGGMGGSIWDWERSLDPWHKDAFKGVPVDEKQIDAFANTGERQAGWMALDAVGNPLGFVADGTEMNDVPGVKK